MSIARHAFSLLLLSGLAGTASAVPNNLKKEDAAFFEKSIRPLLVKHCYKCHSEEATKLKGGLYLDSQEGWMNGGDSGEALEPGNPDDSLLMQAVRYTDPDMQMPPKYKLSDKELEALHRWIKIGAPDPRTGGPKPKNAESSINIEAGRKFWAFQAPKPQTLPKVKDAWPQTDIDRFIVYNLGAKGIQPVKDADRRTLIRRARFDLTGLPPSPEEIAAFENDPADDREAFAKVIDRLLKSPQFGERWGRHWLDVVRYAESMGRTRNYPFPFAWRYRDYVINAFNNDKPFDVFVREQIAGDLIKDGDAKARDERRIATGFLTLGSMDLNERDKEQYRMDQIDEQIDTTGRAIMALTTGCARCHDHKFDPIRQKDYYALAGIFRSTETLSGYYGRGGGNKGYFNPSMMAVLDSIKGTTLVSAQPEAPKVDPKIQKRILQERRKLQEIKAQVAEAKKSDRKKVATLQKQVRAGEQRIKKLTQQSKKKKRGGGGDIRKNPNFSRFAMAVRDREKVENCKINIRGDVHTLGEEVPRRLLPVLCSTDPKPLAGESSGRLELANWLASKDHPLTARVMANRVWHHLFGNGLVRTVDNFGEMGERPTHPELLDHLAVRFMEQGWSVKKLIREIMLSRTYRLSSDHSEAGFAEDPENRLLWRMNVRRLEVEALRDSMLYASGQIDLKAPEKSRVHTSKGGEIRGANNQIAEAMNSNHRSVYLPIVRSFVPEMLTVFDFAEPSQVTGKRDVTTVSTQALFMMNDDFVIGQSGHAAERTVKMNAPDARTRIEFAYEQTLGRKPTSVEAEHAEKFLGEFADELSNDKTAHTDAWSALYQSLFASAEFRYVR